MKPTFIDLFAGIGGMRLGFTAAGFDCVFSSEIDESCRQTYFTNFKDMPHGDIRKIKETDIPNFNVLCAGFPCQPFSISGKQKGFEDTRGTLFFEILRIAEAKNPDIIFLENVKHLVNHQRGQTLKTILSCLENLGYCTTWQILNAADFGVPQNRERIIIIGSKHKEFNFNALKKESRIPLKNTLTQAGEFEFLQENEYTLIENPKTQKSGLIFVGYRNKSIRKTGVKTHTEHLSRVHRQPNRIYSAEGLHPTLTSQETSGRFFILDNDRVRKLIIDECFSLMGFPDNFIKVNPKTKLYQQIGNSVCVPMIHRLAKEIITQIM